MAANSVRISSASRARLAVLAQSTGKTKVALLDEALKALETKIFWESFNQGYEQHGPAYRAEVAALDGAFNDGLPPIAEEDEL